MALDGGGGVDTLLEAYRQADFSVRHQPIFDQRVCSLAEMQDLVRWIREHLEQSASLVVHCVGGLGRSGLVAACYLKSQGLEADAAIAEVRRARSPRAVESAVQEEFVRNFIVTA